jgi:hypothetical protein
LTCLPALPTILAAPLLRAFAAFLWIRATSRLPGFVLAPLAVLIFAVASARSMSFGHMECSLKVLLKTSAF